MHLYVRLCTYVAPVPALPDGVRNLPVCLNELGKQRVALNGYLRIASLRDGANAAHRAAAQNRWVCHDTILMLQVVTPAGT